MSTDDTLRHLLREKILFMDGAMGTMVQRYKLSEGDFRVACSTCRARVLGRRPVRTTTKDR